MPFARGYLRWDKIHTLCIMLKTTTTSSIIFKHHIRLPSKEGASGIDMEVLFLALDQPKDVRKLLSLELTGAFVNESKELPKAVIDGLSHRVGRYPTKSDGGPTWRGIILDSNPCDDDHWLYNMAEKEKPSGKFKWGFYKQPGGVKEVHADEVPADMPEAQGFMYQAENGGRPIPKAENLDNLPVGYYEQLVPARPWIGSDAMPRVNIRMSRKVDQFGRSMMTTPCPMISPYKKVFRYKWALTLVLHPLRYLVRRCRMAGGIFSAR